MRFFRQAVVPTLTGILIFLVTTLPLRAAEGENVDPVATNMGIFFKWLNFAIVFGGIAYLLAKHGGAAFRANAKVISSKITEATTAKAAADAELHEVQAKISNLDRDISVLKDEAARETTVEAARLRESAKVEIEKIKQAAQVELVSAERAARQELRGMAASMAVQRAGAEVNSRMSSEIRARLFRSFLGEIKGSKN